MNLFDRIGYILLQIENFSPLNFKNLVTTEGIANRINKQILNAIQRIDSEPEKKPYSNVFTFIRSYSHVIRQNHKECLYDSLNPFREETIHRLMFHLDCRKGEDNYFQTSEEGPSLEGIGKCREFSDQLLFDPQMIEYCHSFKNLLEEKLLPELMARINFEELTDPTPVQLFRLRLLLRVLSHK